MSVFLDVGAHDGQTLEEVIKPQYGFGSVYAFEPMLLQYNHLQDQYGYIENVRILPFGLWNQKGKYSVYGDNSHLEASMFQEKIDVDENIESTCMFLKASDVVSKFSEQVVMKLNVEGAEVTILRDLIETGAIFNCRSIMVDFDCVKIPGQEHLKQQTIDQMNSVGFDRYCLAEDVMVGDTHGKRIAHWLRTIGIGTDG
jgi:FkbM family methyltransferase